MATKRRITIVGPYINKNEEDKSLKFEATVKDSHTDADDVLNGSTEGKVVKEILTTVKELLADSAIEPECEESNDSCKETA